MKVLALLLALIQRRRRPCSCGGVMVEGVGWAANYSACQKCGKEAEAD